MSSEIQREEFLNRDKRLLTSFVTALRVSPYPSGLGTYVTMVNYLKRKNEPNQSFQRKLNHIFRKG